MLDGVLKKRIDPWLETLGRAAAARGIAADQVTITGAVLGIAAAATISSTWYLAGLVLLLLSRLMDGLDGAVARATRKTDFGGFLDIVLDFLFYGAIPLGFILADPAANAIAGSVLLLSFYVNGASFLAYSVLAERRGMETGARGVKSLYFTTGLAEATETFAVFILACLVPGWFPVLAWLFAAVCFYTALSRIILAKRTFG